MATVALLLWCRATTPIPIANRIAHASAWKKLVVKTSLSNKSEPVISTALAAEITTNSAQTKATAAIWMWVRQERSTTPPSPDRPDHTQEKGNTSQQQRLKRQCRGTGQDTQQINIA
jgi:hypothetical protein